MSDQKASKNKGPARESGMESLQVGSVVYTTRLTKKVQEPAPVEATRYEAD